MSDTLRVPDEDACQDGLIRGGVGDAGGGAVWLEGLTAGPFVL